MADHSEQRRIFLDTDSMIRSWGSEWENVFGYTAAEAVGKKTDLIVPPELRGRHLKGFHKAVTDGRRRTNMKVFRVPAVHKSGSVIALSLADVVIVKAADGTVQGAEGWIVGRGSGWAGAAWRMALSILRAGQRLRPQS
jgi:PAS domain S-box-containing protein